MPCLHVAQASDHAVAKLSDMFESAAHHLPLGAPCRRSIPIPRSSGISISHSILRAAWLNELENRERENIKAVAAKMEEAGHPAARLARAAAEFVASEEGP